MQLCMTCFALALLHGQRRTRLTMASSSSDRQGRVQGADLLQHHPYPPAQALNKCGTPLQAFLEANGLSLILRSHEGPDARDRRSDLPQASI